jgi:hypothetical protein
VNETRKLLLKLVPDAKSFREEIPGETPEQLQKRMALIEAAGMKIAQNQRIDKAA